MTPMPATPGLFVSTDDGRDWIASLSGDGSGDMAGRHVSGIGDINNDGFDDIAVSAPGTEVKVHVIFGSAEGLSGTQNLAATSAARGMQVTGLTGEGKTNSTSLQAAGIGDFNGDGIDDFIIGEGQQDRAHVIFGSEGGLPSETSIASLDGTTGVTLQGIGKAGGAVSGAGDVNGDGIADILIGAWRAGEYPLAQSGKSYLVFGRDTEMPTEIDLEALDGEDGFAVLGEEYSQWSGNAVSEAGDFNNDGFDDFLIGSPEGSAPLSGTGQAYLIFGGPSGFPAELELADINGVNGIKLIGKNFVDNYGSSLDSAGDVNGDGIDDIVVGAKHSEAAYVIFGTEAAQSPTLKMDDLDGTNGFIIEGDRDSELGATVSGAGDLDGDGIDDLIISAYDGRYLYGTPGPGSAFVIFGSREGFDARNYASLLGERGLELVGEEDYDRFGYSVSSAGDFDGDGQIDLLVGAIQDRSYDSSVPDGPGEAYLLQEIRPVVTNKPPVAVDDAPSIGEDDTGPVRFNVLANDSDPEGNGVEFVSYSFDDPRGTLTHLGRGVFEFSPDGDFEDLQADEVLPLELRYTIRDSVGTRSEALASILVIGAEDMHDFSVRLELGSGYDPEEGVPEGWRVGKLLGFVDVEDADDTPLSAYDYTIRDPSLQVGVGNSGQLFVRPGVFIDNDVTPVLNFEISVTSPGGTTVTRDVTFDVADRFDTIRPDASTGQIVSRPESEIIVLDADENEVVRDVSEGPEPDYLRGLALGDSLLFTGIDFDGTTGYDSLYARGYYSRFRIGGAETVIIDADLDGVFLDDFRAGPDSYVFVAMPQIGVFEEGVAIPDETSLGVRPSAILDGAFFDGMMVTLQESGARMDNYLGYYVLDESGALADFGTVFQNVNGSLAGRTRGIRSVEDDQKLGFFLVADGADRLKNGPDSLEIVGDRLVVRESGAMIDARDVYSTDFASADGLEHVAMGRESFETLIGFEDTYGGGDRDFQDVLIEIENFLI